MIPSIIDGCKLSGALILRYKHVNVSDLEQLLIENKPKFRKILVITDGVFSMDGDLAPLDEIYKVTDKSDVFSSSLYLSHLFHTTFISRWIDLNRCVLIPFLPHCPLI